MKIIGIIGFGNMGSSIALRIKEDYRVLVFDKDKTKISNLSDGLEAVDNLKNLVAETEVVILAVKPQDFVYVLGEIKGLVSDKLVISIAAGISTKYRGDKLGVVRVIRVMPNMPARIGEGTSCIAQGKFASEEDLDFTENLFDYVGETLVIEENMMNHATAVSGSGPGFCCDLIESKKIDYKDIDNIRQFVNNEFVPALTLSAIKIGFNDQDAKFLAANTGNGCIALLKEEKYTPAEIRIQVTSKGGTTEAGLEVLHKGGSLEEAVKAALKRAEELSEGAK